MTISSQDREATVLSIIGQELDVAPEQLQESASLIEDLNADSLALINIVMNVEEHFNIEVPEVEWRKLKTVGDVISYVRSASGTAAL